MRQPLSTVKILYVGSLSDGTIFDDRRGGEPLEVKLGMHAVPSGLEEVLFELPTGEEATIVIPPEKGYGQYNDDLVFAYPLAILPNGNELPVGEIIEMTSKKTDLPAYAKVLRIEDDVAYIDFNPPLAGVELTYWVCIVEEKCPSGPRVVEI